MKFACIGGDRRQVEIAAYLSSIGHEVIAFGLPRDERFQLSTTVFEAINQSDAVVLPLPVSRDANTVNTPLTGDVILLNDLLLCRPHLVFGGIISPILRKELENRNIEYYDYYDSEALTVKNAVLTAEAAIAIAVSCTDFSLFGSKSLVLGYGRIGRQLARYLKALGSSVTATTRTDGIMAVIEADCITPLKTQKCIEKCAEFDFIFNTVPAPILDRSFFKACKKTVFIEDLATDSGIDLASAHELGLNAAVYSGLPGKHSPKKAAQFIAEEILSFLERREKYAK